MKNNRTTPDEPEEPGTPKNEPLEDQRFFKSAVEDKNPLINAVMNFRAGEVTKLLKEKADPNVKRDSDGSTPLHIAAEFGHLFVVNDLLRFKAAPNETRKDGKTPIDLATEKKFDTVADALLEAKDEILKKSNRK